MEPQRNTIQRALVLATVKKLKCHPTVDDHVRCTTCQHVFDVEMDYIPDLKNKIKDNHGFQIGEHNIIFAGICPKCLSQEK